MGGGSRDGGSHEGEELMPAYTKCPFCEQLEYELQKQTPQEKAANSPREYECRACGFTGRCSNCGDTVTPDSPGPQSCSSSCQQELDEWQKADEQIGDRAWQ